MLLFSLLISIILGLTASGFFFLWLTLELNSLVFCFMLNNDLFFNPLTTLKYFMIQAFSSSIFFSSNLFFLLNSSPETIASLLFFLSVFLKLGMYPLHYWILSICNNISWPNFIILLTLQKFIPLTLLKTSSFNMFIIVVSLLGIIVGTVSSFTVSSTQKVLVYSSIFNLGWIILVTLFNYPLGLTILFIYSILLFSLTMILSESSIFFTQQLHKKNLSFKKLIIFFISICSIGGFPPTLGFLMKISMMKEMLALSIPLLFIIITLTLSLLLLNFYLSFCLIHLSWFKSSFIFNLPSKLSILPSMIIFTNMFPLFFILSFLIF